MYTFSLKGEEESFGLERGSGVRGYVEIYRFRVSLVGMLRVKSRISVCWKYGMLKMLVVMIVTEFEGFTKNLCLFRIMFRFFGRRGVKGDFLIKLLKKLKFFIWGFIKFRRMTFITDIFIYIGF